MDNLKTAFLKGLGVVCIGCAQIAFALLCLYLTVWAFSVSPLLGFAALFVDAVIVATFRYYDGDIVDDDVKKPTVGK